MKVTPEITNEILQKYVCGQFEWNDLIERSSIFAGIKEIKLNNDRVQLKFSWAVNVLRSTGEILLRQNFNYPQYTICSSEGEIKQKKFINDDSEEKTVYEVIEITNTQFLYKIRLYPPGSLGLQVDQLKERGIEIPN